MGDKRLSKAEIDDLSVRLYRLVSGFNESNYDLDDVEDLLDQGADPNFTNERSQAVLELAILNNMPDLVVQLIDYGARYDSKDWDKLHKVLSVKYDQEVIDKLRSTTNEALLASQQQLADIRRSNDSFDEFVRTLQEVGEAVVHKDTLDDELSGNELLQLYGLMDDDVDNQTLDEDLTGEELLQKYGLLDEGADLDSSDNDLSGDDLLREFGLVDNDPEPEKLPGNRELMSLQVHNQALSKSSHSTLFGSSKPLSPKQKQAPELREEQANDKAPSNLTPPGSGRNSKG